MVASSEAVTSALNTGWNETAVIAPRCCVSSDLKCMQISEPAQARTLLKS